MMGTGILRSTDGGVTFSENLFANPNGTPKPGAPVPGQLGYLSFTQSTRPNNLTMYASVDAAGNSSYLGLFKSTDGGTTWSIPSGSAQVRASEGIQSGYDNVVEVDPRDSRLVFLGFVDLYTSADGGLSFLPAWSRNDVHPDQHVIAFSPLSHNENPRVSQTISDVYAGNDGGIFAGSFRSLTLGFWRSLNRSIATTLITRIGMGKNPEGKPAYAGVWDNGASSSNEQQIVPNGDNPRPWVKNLNGDGGDVAVDPDDPMTCYQRGNFDISMTTNGGMSWSSARNTLPSFAGIVSISGSIRIPGSAPGSVLIRGGHLYISIGNDLYSDYSRINSFPSGVFSIAAASPPRLWVTLWDNSGSAFSGTLWYKDDVTPWTNRGVLGAPGINNGKFAKVAINPLNPDIVCAVYDGFTGIGSSNPTQHVFLSTTNGRTWFDVSGNLPDLPVHDVVIDAYTSPASIIIATDAGVMRTRNPRPGGTWEIMGTGLPTVNGTSLAIFSDANRARLRVGTWGRSVWELVYAH
jgi:hypothetical protein